MEEQDPHRVYEKVVDIGGDCYFLEDDQTSLKMGCKSYIEFKKTFDPKLYNRSLGDIEYLFGKYLAFGKHQLDTFSGDDKDNLIHLLTTRIKQLKESNEYSSARIVNSRMRTYVDNINAILAKLGEGEVVPNNVGEAETFKDEELYQFILELSWFLTHANKVPKQNRKLWNEMVKKMKEIGLGGIAEQIRSSNSIQDKLESPPTSSNFFKGVPTTQMKNARTLRQAVGDSDDTLRPKFESLLALLRMKGYLGQNNSYNVSMEEALRSKMLNQKAVQGPKARTGVQKPVASKGKGRGKGKIHKLTFAKAPSSASAASSSSASAAASSSSASAASSSKSKQVVPSSFEMAAPSALAAVNEDGEDSGNNESHQGEDPEEEDGHPPGVGQHLEGQPHTGGGNLTLTDQTDDLNTDTLYQLTSPLFDYIRVLFDPIYSILQRPEFEMDITLITIIPLLHACMNIKLPGIYRVLNIDPDVKTCIDKMLGATQQYLSTLTKPESKKQFLEQLRILPRMHLTSLIGPSSNSNHYKDPSTFPAIQFLSLGVNFTVNEEKKEELPDGFFDENNLYLSNTQETSTTNKLKGLFSSNSNKKIKLYTLDWNTIKASKASLDLQNDKKEINPDTLEINPEVLFNDSELFLKTIMIVHHIFPGKNTFTPIEQPEPEPTPKAEPEEEKPEEEEEEETKAESTCKTDLVAKECTGTPSERKKQYRKQTVVLHPDKHSTNGCEKEAENAFKDLQSKKSCTETNENAVAPSNTVVIPSTNAPLALTSNTPVAAPTTNSIVAPTTNAPLALTSNTAVVAPTTNAPLTNTTAIVIPNQVK
jgi:hypothetical protein